MRKKTKKDKITEMLADMKVDIQRERFTMRAMRKHSEDIDRIYDFWCRATSDNDLKLVHALLNK